MVKRRRIVRGKRELQGIALIVAALILQIGGGAMAAENTVSLAISTGGTGGTYYPLGAALAQAISEKGEGVSATAQSGNASVANCNLIARSDVETAFVQNNVADDAYNGRGMFEGHAVTNLRAIAALYPETVQVVARRAAGVKNLSEARGKIIAVGDKYSGTEVDTRNILLFHNLRFNDIKPLYVSFSVAAQRLRENQGDVLFTTAGYPTSSIIDLMAVKECNFVNFDPEAVKKLCAKFPFYVPITIPSNTYKGQTEQVNSVATMALWLTHSNMDNDVVYKVTKALWAKDNQGESGADVLARTHDQGRNIKLETALNGVTIPLHPGAERFYREAGLIK
jgi:uncharacterized protein